MISSVSQEDDDKRWLHVSLSQRGKEPTWDEVKEVRRIFTPLTRTALQVLPPPSQYVDLHPYCFHLWVCMDGDVTPDFRVDSVI